MSTTLDVLGYLFLISLVVDVFALGVIVGKVGGSVKRPWDTCTIFALLAWAASYLLFYSLATALQSL